jgi:hypothetical protein
MNDNDVVADHLRAALRAADADKPFLAYLIQMALIETISAADDLQHTDSANRSDEESPHYKSASEFLSRLPQSQHRARLKTSFL